MTEQQAFEMVCRNAERTLVALQAAWIEWQHGRGAEAAMEWIENTLDGPGNIPEVEEIDGMSAQQWFDKHNPGWGAVTD